MNRTDTPYPDLDPFLRRLQDPLTQVARQRAESTVAEASAATPRTPRRWQSAVRGRRLVLAAAVVATVAVGAAVVPGLLPDGTGVSSAAAATLEQAAVGAGRQTAEPLRGGRYWYTKTKIIHPVTVWIPLESSVPDGPPPGQRREPDKDGRASATATAHYGTQEIVVERWIGPDGSGRVREVASMPTFATEKDRSVWLDSVRKARPGELRGQGTTDRRFGPGQLMFGMGGPALTYEKLLALPTEPDALARWLRQELHKIRGDKVGRAQVEAFVTAAALDLLRDAPATPALRAALYRVLATADDMRLNGPTRDPLGRSGLSIVHVDKSTSVEFVVDPSSGELLAQLSRDTSPDTDMPGRTTVLVTSGVTEDSTGAPRS